MHYGCANIFGAIVLKLRLKIDVVVMIVWSVVIIINSVLTFQVSTASLPHNQEPCKIKVVSNHTCSLHTFVCAGSRRVRVRLSGFQRQESVQLLGVSSSALFRSGSVPNMQKVFKWRWRIWQIRVICGTQNCLLMRGKYLNIFGEYTKRIYAYIEMTQRSSWHILLICQET
jgi:hypothetical protein